MKPNLLSKERKSCRFKNRKNSSKTYSAEICEQEIITEPVEELRFEYIDEVKVSEPELIQEMVKFQGIINTENISPSPYDPVEMFEFSDNPPEYFASYLPPPESLIQKLN